MGEASTGPTRSVAWRRGCRRGLGVAARSRFLHRVAWAQIAAARSRGRLPAGPVVLPPRASWTRCAATAGSSSARSRARRRGPRCCAGFDLITTSFPHYVDALPRRWASTREYLKIAFDERVLERLQARGVDAGSGRERPHGVVVRRRRSTRRVHAAGTALLERLCGARAARRLGLRRRRAAGGSPIAHATTVRRGASTCTRCSRARGSSLNRHIDVAEGYANNMRLFEATGVGALLLTEAAPNLADLFEPGRGGRRLRRRGRPGREDRALPRARRRAAARSRRPARRARWASTPTRQRIARAGGDPGGSACER